MFNEQTEEQVYYKVIALGFTMLYLNCFRSFDVTYTHVAFGTKGQGAPSQGFLLHRTLCCPDGHMILLDNGTAEKYMEIIYYNS